MSTLAIKVLFPEDEQPITRIFNKGWLWGIILDQLGFKSSAPELVDSFVLYDPNFSIILRDP